MTTQFTPQDAFEFLQKMWNPLGVAMPGYPPAVAPGPSMVPPFANPAAMMAALDPAEVEKKIAEMRVVENWLSMTLGWVQMSIKTMELQKASLEAFRAAATGMPGAGGSGAGGSGAGGAGGGGAGGAPERTGGGRSEVPPRRRSKST